MFYGYLDFSLSSYIIYTLVVTQITILGVTIFLHRCQAHRALTLHPIVSHFFRLWLWLTTGMLTKAWAAIHRKHHAKCETNDDPHSPQVLGLKQVLLEGTELYKREANNAETLSRYGAGTPDDWIERNIYTKHSAGGIKLLLLINIILLGVPGITIWAIQMMWIPLFAAGIINGIGHFVGYRNFNCPDASRNISPIGCIIGGEELHNNHHTYPTSAKMSVKPWEFDLGWAVIKTLSFFKLATVKRTPPQEILNKDKKTIDVETIKAVIANRFQIMASYTNKVLMPILKTEDNKQLKKLVLKDSITPDVKLGTNLAAAYNLKTQLQEIWDKTTASQKELIEALHNWCLKAEESGINSLKEFASYIKAHQKVA